MTRNPNLQLPTPETGRASGRGAAGEAWRCNLREESLDLMGPRSPDWWTGKSPQDCPGLSEDGALHSTPLPDLSRCSRADLLDHFDNGWTLTELLFAGLQGDEAFFRPPYHHLRHPMIFYYGHAAVLYVNKLRVAGLVQDAVQSDFEQLLETGVDEMSWDDLGKNDLPWPSVREVTEYRRQVYRIVRGILETHPDVERLPITEASPLWAVVMGMEHERIHLELSSVLLRELPLNLVRRPEFWPEDHPSARRGSSNHPPEKGRDYPANEMLSVPTGDSVLGKPREWPSYGWDNEYGERRQRVRAFEASRNLVSNGEFWQFLNAGGYQSPRYWSDEGWRWRAFRNVKSPTFWIADGPAGLQRFRLRLLFESVPMPWDWPAELNWYEAKAYCAWLTEKESRKCPYRLPTEAEHHRLRPRPARNAADAREEDPAMRWTGAEMAKNGLNLGLAWGSPNPVDASPPDGVGFRDVTGNLWQWCEDHFSALPGFEVHRLYDDFSTPCFDGKHHLILGGSFVSTGDEASLWARFHFRPHFHQHTGLRLVRPSVIEDGKLDTSCVDAPPPHVGNGPCCTRKSGGNRGKVYESRQMVNEYLMLHYGTEAQVAAHRYISPEVLEFPKRCANRLARVALERGCGTERVLDIGCAVGGSSFELTRTFGRVLGIDLSEKFVQSCEMLKQHGRMEYERREEGELHRRIAAVVDPSLDRSKAEFRQADACSLPADLGTFDAVLIANVLCRLPSPRALLSRLGGPRALVKPGGIVLMTTPWTWMEEFTPRGSWLGGLERDGRELRSKDGLQAALEGEFDLLESDDMPLLIREHARKFQYIVAGATVWRRHGPKR